MKHAELCGQTFKEPGEGYSNTSSMARVPWDEQLLIALSQELPRFKPIPS